MQKIKISNMHTNGHNVAANQFIIETEAGTYFQSYDSVVAFIPKNEGPIILGPDWDYSNTTRRYLYKFLNLGHVYKKDITDGIKAGRFIVEDLNIVAPNFSKFKRADISRTLEALEADEVSIDELIEQLKMYGEG